MCVAKGVEGKQEKKNVFRHKARINVIIAPASQTGSALYARPPPPQKKKIHFCPLGTVLTVSVWDGDTLATLYVLLKVLIIYCVMGHQ